jgi:hypothetical protein
VDLLDGLERVAEQVTPQLLETGTGENGRKINTLVEGVGGLHRRGKSAFSMLASST